MRTLIALIALLLSAQIAASDVSAVPSAPQNGWERYKILTQRNIFSKDRGKPREERRSENRDKEKETPPPPKPEADITLIGILDKDGKLAAFFENSKAGTILTVRTGEAIARGKLGEITLDRVEYILDGATVNVAIGNNLEGGTGSKSSGPIQSSSGGSTGPSDANALLERMRKKRQEEMRK